MKLKLLLSVKRLKLYYFDSKISSDRFGKYYKNLHKPLHDHYLQSTEMFYTISFINLAIYMGPTQVNKSNVSKYNTT